MLQKRKKKEANKTKQKYFQIQLTDKESLLARLYNLIM
jgi:hypothetical protein